MFEVKNLGSEIWPKTGSSPSDLVTVFSEVSRIRGKIFFRILATQYSTVYTNLKFLLLCGGDGLVTQVSLGHKLGHSVSEFLEKLVPGILSFTNYFAAWYTVYIKFILSKFIGFIIYKVQ